MGRSGAWPGWWGWAVVAALLLVQAALFRQFTVREVTWALPTYTDQAIYLNASYESYEDALERGPVAGLLNALRRPTPQGILIHTQAAVLFLLLGPGRLSALTLNFLYFALFQATLVGTLYGRTRRWSIALLGQGLLLSAAVPHFYAGGLTDFRIDFIAFCLFGVFLCTVVWSDCFVSARLSCLAGAVGALLVLFRFFTIIFLGGILGSCLLFFCGRHLLVRQGNRPQGQIRGVVLAGLTLLALTAWPLWHNRRPIWGYYVVGHVLGSEKEIRARQFGVTSPLDALLYYPRSVFWDHAGLLLVVLSGVTLLAAVLLAWLGRRQQTTSRPQGAGLDEEIHARGGNPIGGIFFLVACVAVPLTVLTLNVSKSPIVGSILVPPLLWLVLLALVRLTRPGRLPHLTNAVLGTLALLALVVGLGEQVSVLGRHGPLHPWRADAADLDRLVDTINTCCGQYALDRPRIATNCLGDLTQAEVLKAALYERHGRLLNLTPLLPRPRELLAVAANEAQTRLQEADLVLLVTSPFFPDELVYPFNQAMDGMRPQLQEFCASNFYCLGTFHVFNRACSLYLRPQVRVEGGSGDWITNEGLTLSSAAGVLRAFPQVEMRGQASFKVLGRVPGVGAKVLREGRPEKTVPATLEAVGEEGYLLTVDTTGADLEGEGSVRLRLEFDGYFVPHDLGINEDTRRLVVRMPDQVKLLGPTGKERAHAAGSEKPIPSVQSEPPG